MLTQGDSSDSAYLTPLKLLWDEYAALVLISSCNCKNHSRAICLASRPFRILLFSNSSCASIAYCGYFNGTCDYCKLKGHKHEQCYRLIGFPPYFKFTRRKNVQVAMMVNSDTPDSSPPDSRSLNSLMPAPVFTTE
ncbi:hypothetical protein PVK06_007351 [Gossypium arboreum]|uniref:Uncharacterized protein n=1 Tax=Gossypium arboreum TaxID=29729 RepID=A0ABR0QH28_GOSAR|nr:hypothetical protein PVK06_007351 [Gossypium arboreum]